MKQNKLILLLFFLICASSVNAFFETPSNNIIVTNNLYNGTINLSSLYLDEIFLNGTNINNLYVPYTGAIADVNLGTHDLITSGQVKGSNFFAYRRILSGGDLFYGIGYSGNDITIDNDANIITDGTITSVSQIKGESLYSQDYVVGNAVNKFTNTYANGGVDLQFYGGQSMAIGEFQTASIKAKQDQLWTSDASTKDSSLIFSTARNGTVSENVFISNTGSIGIGINPTDYAKGLTIKDSSVPDVWLTSDETSNGVGFSYQPLTDKGILWAWNANAMEWDADGHVTFPVDIAVTGDITADGLIVQPTSGNMLYGLIGNYDVNVWSVDGLVGGTYGFNLMYKGTGVGNDNTLQLWADNQAGTPALVYEVTQDGVMSIEQEFGIGGDTITFGGNQIELAFTSTTDASIGIGLTPTAEYQTLIGFSNTASDRSVNIGVLNNGLGNYAVNLGYDADSGATKTVSIGYGTDATASGNIAIGNVAQATASDNAIAIGGASSVTGNKGIAIGQSAITSQTSSVAIGYSADAIGGYGCVALGSSAQATGSSSFAMGYLAEAYHYSNGLGAGTKATGSFSNAIGYGAEASNSFTIAIGTKTSTLNGSIASGRNSIAIGSADSTNSVNGAIASGTHSICIGSNCTNSIDNEMKIGGMINSVLIDGDLNVTGNISSGNGYTGNCINASYLNGIVVGCND